MATVVAEPTLSLQGPSKYEVWHLDHAATHYRVMVVTIKGTTLVACGFGYNNDNVGWTQLEFAQGPISIWYLAEKLNLRPGDLEGWKIILSAALKMEVR